MPSERELTADGHHVVIDGRKWRATDPSIPKPLRAELVSVLMSGRRRVRTDGDSARPVVHDAKVALGERGEPWWEPTDEGVRDRLAATIRTLLRHRGQSSICPSEAARTVGGESWRHLMGQAREVSFILRDEGAVRILQRGQEISGEIGPDTVSGPIRIAAGDALLR